MSPIGVRQIIFLEKNIAVGDAVSAKSYYNYKTGFETWRGNLAFERQKSARSLKTLDSTPVGAKTIDPKTLTMDL